MSSNILLFFILSWNLFVFFIFFLDKYNAIKKRHRIKEKNLIILSFLFGAFGALLGVFVLKHKTRHLNFIILIPVSLILNIFFIFLIYSKLT